MREPIKDRIAKVIKALRRDQGLNQEGFAKRVGVNQSKVSRWENAKAIDVADLYDLADAFDLPVTHFLPKVGEGVSEGVGLTLRRLYREMEEIAEEFDALESLTGGVSYRPATGNGDQGKDQQGGGPATSGGRNDDDAPDP